jgi:hypothetical protein
MLATVLRGFQLGCGAWVLKNCLEGIVFMNRRALCDKMCLCLQDAGSSCGVMQG